MMAHSQKNVNTYLFIPFPSPWELQATFLLSIFENRDHALPLAHTQEILEIPRP